MTSDDDSKGRHKPADQAEQVSAGDRGTRRSIAERAAAGDDETLAKINRAAGISRHAELLEKLLQPRVSIDARNKIFGRVAEVQDVVDAAAAGISGPTLRAHALMLFVQNLRESSGQLHPSKSRAITWTCFQEALDLRNGTFAIVTNDTVTATEYVVNLTWQSGPIDSTPLSFAVVVREQDGALRISALGVDITLTADHADKELYAKAVGRLGQLMDSRRGS